MLYDAKQKLRYFDNKDFRVYIFLELYIAVFNTGPSEGLKIRVCLY